MKGLTAGVLPVQGTKLDELVYRIESMNENPDDEEWAFETGSIVQCEQKNLSGGDCKVAIQKLAERNELISKSTQQ